MALRVAVDAWNLRADRRGMGRYVRRILRDWETYPDLEVTLIVRSEDDAEHARTEFPYRVIRNARDRYDAVWYPWNALRFTVRGARRVVTVHDPFAFTLAHRDPIARWREQRPIHRALRDADALATNSAWTAHELARLFAIDAARCTLIHPVPDPFWKPTASAPPRAPYIFVVAGPDERKNLSTLFAAYDRAFTNDDAAPTLIVAGVLREHDEALLAQSRYRHERLQPDDDTMRALYSGALAVAVPSSHEGYGLMVLEAMACGAPVLAADAAALPEACDRAALLIPPFDIDAWTAALRQLSNDTTIREHLRTQSLARAERIDRTLPAHLTRNLLLGTNV